MYFEKFYAYRKLLIGIFLVLTLAGVFFIPRLSYDFSFEQFFPQGDEDLEFFQSFVEEFESDDNFLLIAFPNKPSVFDSTFLSTLDEFSVKCRELPYVQSVRSLTRFRYPVKTPFGPSSIPAIHLDDSEKLKQDSIRLMNDDRVVYNLVNEDATATSLILKTKDGLFINESKELMKNLNLLLEESGFSQYHILGRAYFQDTMSRMQVREITLSTIISGILVTIIMVFLYRRPIAIMIALSTIGIGLILFLAMLSVLGRELTLMAALYPVLMLIVGTSDVVHIMTKYIDELKKGLTNKEAIQITIKQIGLATLMTSTTTAAGFATLMSSRIQPIQGFGLNAAIGVILAYIVVIAFTCPLLSLFGADKLTRVDNGSDKWSVFLSRFYEKTRKKETQIWFGFIIFLGFSIWGISMIHTNYSISSNLPKGEKITADFRFFEEEFSGFRPLEIAGFIQEPYEIYNYEVVETIDRLERYIKNQDEIQSAFSLATIARSINQMNNSNRKDAYEIPVEAKYRTIESMMGKVKIEGTDMLVSKDRRKTRISAKIKDVGSEKIGEITKTINNWIDQNTDNEIISFRQTGTGLILDKNSEFVRSSLLTGLGIALVIVSLLMGILFRSPKMLFLALIPNIIPLVFAAAILGLFNVALEAGITIVFAIIFGIAVDDTIHFLSRYKLAKDVTGDTEEALKASYHEAGKAIIFTSIILFFGFLVLLFSVHPPSVIIGSLIAVTLVSAVVADLTILPALIRKFDL
ncbi:MAG: MMPL family transporter [Saprospiraceae bacterium]|nr:MMPL family transporter [Saprospiraceae bacterium]